MIQQGMPKAGHLVLKRAQLQTLAAPGLQYGAAYRTVRQQLDKVDCTGRIPGITPRPERAAEVVTTVKRPAVVPQVIFLAEQVLDVQQELILRLLHPRRLAQRAPGTVKEEHRHKERIIPKLLLVDVVCGDVLKAALLRARHILHDPLRPIANERDVLRIARVLVEQYHAQHRGRGVDVAHGQSLAQVRFIPAGQEGQQLRAVRLLVYLEHGVHGNALGPFPGIQREVVVLPAALVDVDELAHHELSGGGVLGFAQLHVQHMRLPLL